MRAAIVAWVCSASISLARRIQAAQEPTHSTSAEGFNHARPVGNADISSSSLARLLFAYDSEAAFNPPTASSFSTLHSTMSTPGMNLRRHKLATMESTDMPKLLKKAASRRGELVLVKYGGHAMTNDERAAEFASDIALLQNLGLRPVVVHGGGPQINEMLSRLEIESTFVDGRRVTTPAILEVVEMVLCGKINKKLAAAINAAGGRAVGLSGKDDALVQAVVENEKMGLVGKIQKVRISLLEKLIEEGIVPVIAPVGYAPDGTSLNINADTMAGAIGGALKASNMLLLTDVAGVLDGPDGKLIPRLTPSGVQKLKDDGVATGGMIPKLGTAVDAVKSGCETSVVMDGRVPHCTLEYLFGANPVGTQITEEA